MFVRIKSKRICHKTIYGKIGELFGSRIKNAGVTMYGVSCGGKDYELYPYEFEEVDEL